MSIELIFNEPSDFKGIAPKLDGSWMTITDHDLVNHEGWSEADAIGIELTDDNGDGHWVGYSNIAVVNV